MVWRHWGRRSAPHCTVPQCTCCILHCATWCTALYSVSRFKFHLFGICLFCSLFLLVSPSILQRQTCHFRDPQSVFWHRFHVLFAELYRRELRIKAANDSNFMTFFRSFGNPYFIECLEDSCIRNFLWTRQLNNMAA